MTKIYDALRRAEQEQGPAHGLPRLPVEPRSHALRQKMIAVCQTIESRLPDKTSRVVMFVGPRPGEGASVLVRELAKLASAELAQRVALIDLMPGGGGHYEHFGVALQAGLNDVTAGRATLADAVQPVNDNPSLCLACVATGETSASVVVASPQFSEQMHALRKDFSLILLDAPPISESSDALLAVPETDGIVIVIEAETTRWQVAENTREKLAMQGGNILGVILNKRRFYIPSFIYRRM
jgi:Mrp family chromosome partitioning ATPase